mmetsp:Transcript_55464/g.174012  ORF Transcript_55464/g.174012 Transcript_55464/m.174012 type:complete len:232 (-) Transcript_55464:227-922(-)
MPEAARYASRALRKGPPPPGWFRHCPIIMSEKTTIRSAWKVSSVSPSHLIGREVLSPTWGTSFFASWNCLKTPHVRSRPCRTLLRSAKIATLQLSEPSDMKKSNSPISMARSEAFVTPPMPFADLANSLYRMEPLTSQSTTVRPVSGGSRALTESRMAWSRAALYWLAISSGNLHTGGASGAGSARRLRPLPLVLPPPWPKDSPFWAASMARNAVRKRCGICMDCSTCLSF